MKTNNKAAQKNPHKILKEIFICSFPFLMWMPSCTNLEFNQTYDRMDDNSTLNQPADIDPAGVNSFTFAAMGDTHMGGPGNDIMGDMLDRIAADGDAFVIVAGDITNSGTVNQYNTFVNTMVDKGFDNLFRTAIGNHDIYFNGWSHYKSVLGTKSNYSFDADNVHFVMLDTANGIIGRRQLQWLENDLQTTNQPIKVVAAHFPAWNGNFNGIYRLNSDEEVNLLKNILYENSVDYYISAHYHGYDTQKIGRTQFVVTGGANNLIDPGNKKHYLRFTVNGNNITHTYNEH